MGPDPPGASTVLLEGDLVVSACCPQVEAVEILSIQTAAVDSFEVAGILSVCLMISVFINGDPGVFRQASARNWRYFFSPVDIPFKGRLVPYYRDSVVTQAEFKVFQSIQLIREGQKLTGVVVDRSV